MYVVICVVVQSEREVCLYNKMELDVSKCFKLCSAYMYNGQCEGVCEGNALVRGMSEYGLEIVVGKGKDVVVLGDWKIE